MNMYLIPHWLTLNETMIMIGTRRKRTQDRSARIADGIPAAGRLPSWRKRRATSSCTRSSISLWHWWNWSRIPVPAIHPWRLQKSQSSHHNQKYFNEIIIWNYIWNRQRRSGCWWRSESPSSLGSRRAGSLHSIFIDRNILIFGSTKKKGPYYLK